MNNLVLKVRESSTLNTIITIDGQRVKVQKNSSGHKVLNFQTDKKEVELKVFTKPNDLLGKYWILWQLLYFVISIFGIFDWGRYCDNFVLNYSGKIALTENTELDILLKYPKTNGQKAIEVKSGNFDDNDSNAYYFPKEIRTRKKICWAVKIVVWIAIVAIVLAIVGSKIIK